nr:hypothetical protein [Klebsiella michiganensis]
MVDKDFTVHIPVRIKRADRHKTCDQQAFTLFSPFGREILPFQPSGHSGLRSLQSATFLSIPSLMSKICTEIIPAKYSTRRFRTGEESDSENSRVNVENKASLYSTMSNSGLQTRINGSCITSPVLQGRMNIPANILVKH